MGRFSSWVSRALPSSAAAPGEPAVPVTVPPSVLFSHNLVEGQLIEHDCRVDRALGGGSFGTVYAVHNDATGHRYAVKRATIPRSAERATFIARLESWLCLPEHRHLVSCHLLRVYQDHVGIFIEYVEGNTLSRSITGGTLYVGSAQATLERILDHAIQMAWGLQDLHDMGLHHQYLTPQSVYLTPTTTRLTDIGMAPPPGMRPIDGHSVTRMEDSPVRFAAPEKYREEEPNPGMDVWSWAACVLAMFLARSPLPEREESFSNAEIVDHLASTAPREGERPALPAPLAALLRRCFTLEPEQRPDIATIVDLMVHLFHDLLGKPYPRRPPPTMNRGLVIAIAHARWMPAGGVQWRSPTAWKYRALRAVGQPVPEERHERTTQNSRQEQGRIDLPGYEEVLHLFQKLVDSGHGELIYDLAILHTEKGFVHVSIDDLHGALEHFDAAILLLEGLVREGRTELESTLAMAYLDKATALSHLHRLQESVEINEQATRIWTRLVQKEGRRELAGTLAWAIGLRAETLFSLSARLQKDGERMLREFARLTARPDLSEQEPDADTSSAAVLARLNLLPIHRPETLQARQSLEAATAELADEQHQAEVIEDLALKVKHLRHPRPELVEKATSAQVAIAAALEQATDTLKHAQDDFLKVYREGLKVEGEELKASASTLLRLARADANTAMSTLSSEVARTEREDFKALLHWAQKTFEGRS